MFKLIFFALLASAFSANWAVLVAGSNGFSNYRHQSDIFRTYLILTKNGFDPKNIITMCYDDIATASSNPFPGKVFNVPDGPDVYIGTSKIDYRGTNVTAAKWYAVLTGNATAAGGKVLKSTANDNVFIFYNDHGSSGLVAFPSGPYAYADELNSVLKTMYTRKMYKNLLFYVEACYSGSMFNSKLANNMNIYAVTAANERESSYAYYCGIAKYKTCLSNEFSQMWLNQSDNSDLTKVTVGQQFDYVKASTKNSHVMEYGQTSLKTDTLSKYQSGNNAIPEELLEPIRQVIHRETVSLSTQGVAVSQEEAHLTYLKTAAEADMFSQDAVDYHNQLAVKRKEESRRSAMSQRFGFSYPDPSYNVEAAKDMKLFRRAVETYEAICGRLNEFSFWSHTVILGRAINEDKLTEKNFKSFVSFLKSIA